MVLTQFSAQVDKHFEVKATDVYCWYVGINGLFIKARLYHIFHAALVFKTQFGQQFVNALVSLNLFNTRGDEMHSKVSVGLRDIN